MWPVVSIFHREVEASTRHRVLDLLEVLPESNEWRVSDDGQIFIRRYQMLIR
jgi:hypothetical protein